MGILTAYTFQNDAWEISLKGFLYPIQLIRMTIFQIVVAISKSEIVVGIRNNYLASRNDSFTHILITILLLCFSCRSLFSNKVIT